MLSATCRGHFTRILRVREANGGVSGEASLPSVPDAGSAWSARPHGSLAVGWPRRRRLHEGARPIRARSPQVTRPKALPLQLSAIRLINTAPNRLARLIELTICTPQFAPAFKDFEDAYARSIRGRPSADRLQKLAAAWRIRRVDKSSELPQSLFRPSALIHADVPKDAWYELGRGKAGTQEIALSLCL